MDVERHRRVAQLGGVLARRRLPPPLRVGEETWTQSVASEAACSSGRSGATWAPTTAGTRVIRRDSLPLLDHRHRRRATVRSHRMARLAGTRASSTPQVRVREAPLLERSTELGALERLLARVASGAGGVLVIEGEPGIGKTRLLTAATEHARNRGLRSLSAAARELERDLPYGVVSRLLDAVSPPPRLPELHRVVAGLSERGPVLLALDDAHWADPPSLDALAYLAQRVSELPVALAITARDELGAGTERLIDLISDARTTVLSLRGLSEHAVGELAQATLDAPPTDELSAACFAATGGNPFLLVHLLEELAPIGADDRASAVAELAPRGIMRWLTVRLSRLGGNAGDVAKAVSVLADEATADHVAGLVGLKAAAVDALADRLAEAHVLAPARPLRFEHPILGSAIRRAITRAERTDLHARAAAMLEARGVPIGLAAAHLLGADPRGSTEVVAMLRRAAAAARADGAPATAVALLRRALAEPPAPAQRGAVLRELGHALVPTAARDSAVAAFRQAIEATEDPLERAEVAIGCAPVLGGVGAAEEGAALLDGVADGVPASAAGLRARIDAQLAAVSGGVPDQTADTALRALAGGLIEEQGAESVHVAEAIRSLHTGERHEPGDRFLEAAAADARRRGSTAGAAVVSSLAAEASFWRGDLHRARGRLRSRSRQRRRMAGGCRRRSRFSCSRRSKRERPRMLGAATSRAGSPTLRRSTSPATRWCTPVRSSRCVQGRWSRGAP